MRRYIYRLAISLAVYARLVQGQQPAATKDELQYLRFLLMNMASVDAHPNSVKVFEDGLVKQLGLNAHETASIRAAGQEMNALLKQLQQAAKSIAPAKSRLTPASASALAALAEQREQRLEALANRILSQVRAETASRLRMPGRLGASRPKR